MTSDEELDDLFGDGDIFEDPASAESSTSTQAHGDPLGKKESDELVPVSSAPIEVVEAPTAAMQRQERIKALEDSILVANMEVLDAASDWVKAIPNDKDEPPEMPQDWVERYGEQGARDRFKIAQCATLPAKVAPIGLSMALKTSIGIISARERRGSVNVAVNVAIVEIPVPQFEEKEVDE